MSQMYILCGTVPIRLRGRGRKGEQVQDQILSVAYLMGYSLGRGPRERVLQKLHSTYVAKQYSYKAL